MGCEVPQAPVHLLIVPKKLIPRIGEAAAHPMTPGMGHVALKADDFEATLERLKQLGAEPLGNITDFSAGRSVYLRTPFGAFLELEEAPPRQTASAEVGA